MTFGSRKTFPAEALRSIGGELTGTISSNSFTGKPPCLEHDIEIALAPFALGRAAQDTSLKLFTLPLAIRSWRELAGRDYAFPGDAPAMMADGEPVAAPGDGSIQLLDQHLPVRPLHVAFREAGHGAIAADLRVLLDLENIGYCRTEVSLEAVLRVVGVRVMGDVTLLARPSLPEAEALARELLDVHDYEPTLVDSVVMYRVVGSGPA